MGSDVRQHQCSVLQYIGEMCRYALSAPAHDDDASSGLRIAIGNGLRPDIWAQFQERFGIGRINEFYGATEGAR